MQEKEKGKNTDIQNTMEPEKENKKRRRRKLRRKRIMGNLTSAALL